MQTITTKTFQVKDETITQLYGKDYVLVDVLITCTLEDLQELDEDQYYDHTSGLIRLFDVRKNKLIETLLFNTASIDETTPELYFNLNPYDLEGVDDYALSELGIDITTVLNSMKKLSEDNAPIKYIKVNEKEENGTVYYAGTPFHESECYHFTAVRKNGDYPTYLIYDVCPVLVKVEADGRKEVIFNISKNSYIVAEPYFRTPVFYKFASVPVSIDENGTQHLSLQIDNQEPVTLANIKNFALIKTALF